ncbi:hypothetical protein COOONC_04092 [Cooperia oncophora]
MQNVLIMLLILAIYDEQSPNGSDATDGCTVTTPRGPVVGRVRDSVVEIVSLDNPPSNGLRVSSSMTDNHRSTAESSTTTFAVVGSGGSSSGVSDKERLAQPVRSSLRSDGSTPSRHRVTMSPEVEKKLASSAEKDTRLSRGSARKSRLTDSFFDAKERLEDAREASHASPMATQRSRQRAYLKTGFGSRKYSIVDVAVSTSPSCISSDDPFTRSQPGTSSLQNRPILSALQQANTVHIGHTRVVELKKSSKGISRPILFF